MKRKFAVIMSAALAAGSTMPVMAESETAFTPSTYVGEFSLTADGESMLFSITAEQFAEDGVSVSANVTLPPSVTGEEADTVYGLNDVLRVVSGDLYINVAEIASTYGELLGSDISSMLPMFGIDQDWVEIPAIDFAAVETEAETDFDVDSMMNDFTALAENFDIQTAEDGSTTITFDGPAIVNTVKAVENVVDNAMSVLLSQVQGTDASQLVTVFDDFFTCDDSDEISLIINYRDVILIDRTIQKVFHISICVYRFISGASRDSHYRDIFHFLQVSAVDIQSSDAP